MSRRLKLGEIVLRAGVIDELQLHAALGEQSKWGGRLGLILIRLGYVTEQDLVQALASQLDLPVATIEGKKIPKRVLDLVPYDYADDHTCLPLFVKNEEGADTLYVGMDDPSNLEVLDDLAFRTGMRIKPVVVAASEICEGIDRFYRDIEPSARPVQRELRVVPTAFAAEPISSRDSRPFDCEEVPFDANDASDTQPLVHVETLEPPASEPSTRLVLHALAQIMIEKGIMTREEFQHRIELLTACDEGDPDRD